MQFLWLFRLIQKYYVVWIGSPIIMLSFLKNLYNYLISISQVYLHLIIKMRKYLLLKQIQIIHHFTTLMKIFKNHYFMLFFIMLYPIDYSYTRDWPQSLSTVLQQQPYKYTLTQINLMYTFLSAGLILIIFKLGNIYDKIPLKWSLLLIPIINTMSQLGTALLFYFYDSWSYQIVLIMRVIFGISGSSFFILQAIVLTRIFKEKAGPYLGFGNTFGNLGSPLNTLITPIMYDIKLDIFFPLFICFIISTFFILVGIILIKIVKQNEQQQQKRLLESEDSGNITTTINPQAKVKVGILVQIKQLTFQFWILILLIFTTIINTMAFNTLGYDLFVKRFQIPYDHANYLFVIPYTMCFLSSFVWRKITLSLRNCYICITVGTLLFNLTLSFIPNNQSSPPPIQYIYSAILLIFIGTCLGGALMKMFPSVYIITKPENSGATSGLLATCINLMYMTIPIICSLIVGAFDSQQIGYKYLSLIFFTPVSIVSIIIALYIKLSARFGLLQKKNSK